MFFKNVNFWNKKVKISIKNGIFKNAFYKKNWAPLIQGPQKMFGGPHVAHGPHFGHVCYR